MQTEARKHIATHKLMHALDSRIRISDLVLFQNSSLYHLFNMWEHDALAPKGIKILGNRSGFLFLFRYFVDEKNKIWKGMN